MKPNRNGHGNVRHGDDGPEAPWEGPDPEDVRPGDFVSITPSALRMSKLSMMSPRLLHQVGCPNRFQVVHVFDTETDGKCYTLAECCKYLVDHRTGKFRCTGHPAIYFEKKDPRGASPRGRKEKPEPEEPERPRGPGDRGASVSLPWLGEIASMDYREDEHNPSLTIKIGGKTTMFTGQLAKIFAEAARANQIL